MKRGPRDWTPSALEERLIWLRERSFSRSSGSCELCGRQPKRFGPVTLLSLSGALQDRSALTDVMVAHPDCVGAFRLHPQDFAGAIDDWRKAFKYPAPAAATKKGSP